MSYAIIGRTHRTAMSDAEHMGLKMLAEAVFDQAKRDLRSSLEEIRQESETWFLSDDQEYIYSFLNVCAFLKIDPQAVRERYRILSH